MRRESYWQEVTSTRPETWRSDNNIWTLRLHYSLLRSEHEYITIFNFVDMAQLYSQHSRKYWSCSLSRRPNTVTTHQMFKLQWGLQTQWFILWESQPINQLHTHCAACLSIYWVPPKPGRGIIITLLQVKLSKITLCIRSNWDCDAPD